MADRPISKLRGNSMTFRTPNAINRCTGKGACTPTGHDATFSIDLQHPPQTSQKSKMIGLIVAYLDNHFYPTVIELLTNTLEREGYTVLIFMVARGSDDVDDVVHQIIDHKVDGLILGSVVLNADLAQRCRCCNVPMVLFNRTPHVQGDLAVVSDNRMGGRLAADHLIGLGRKRIGHIAGCQDACSQRNREIGFVEGLRAANLELFAREVGDYRIHRAKHAARRMFDTPNRPDAVFVSNDYMAFCVMDVLRSELGLSIPEDVAIIGFDDVLTAAWPAYSLTTIRQDAKAMVLATVATLLSQINGTAPDCLAPLPVSLVRRSTA